jgi:hypothetical protein
MTESVRDLRRGCSNAIIPSDIGDPCERFLYYWEELVNNNQAIMRSLDLTDKLLNPALLNFYFLGIFDGQVNNGGVAQLISNYRNFLENLVTAIAAANIPEVERTFKVILARLDEDDADGWKDWDFHYLREWIKNDAEVFHRDYYPTRGNVGRLRIDFCTAVNAYVESHPDQLQCINHQ